MVASVLQEVVADAAGAATSIASPSLTAAGLTYLHAFVSFGDGATGTVSSITSVPSLTWTVIGSVVRDAGDGQSITQYRSSVTAAGGVVVTANLSGSFSDRGICVKEIGGSDGNVVGNAGQLQATPTTTTDATTSGNTGTLTEAPALLSGICIASGGAGQPAAGTGFTSDGVGWTFGGGTNLMRSESKRVTSTAAVAATFTAAANSAHMSLVAAWGEAASGSSPTPTSPLFLRSASGALAMGIVAPTRIPDIATAAITQISQAIGAWTWNGPTATTSQLMNQSVGAWSWAGTTATTNSVISAIPGAWTWAGLTATTSQLINGGIGSWSWAGATATTNSVIAAGVGAWTWAGTTALTTQLINATPGTWSWAGTTSALGAGVNATPGTYTWSGTTATTNSVISAVLGAWSWNGPTASLSQLINQIAGAWSWAGTTATLNQLINSDGGATAWSWAGTLSSLAVEIVATPGAYTWAGTTASLSQLIAQGVGAWSWAGTTASLSQLINEGVGAYAWSGTTSTVSGSAVFPPPSQVLLGVVYGPNGNDYTGTLVAGGGTLWIRR